MPAGGSVQESSGDTSAPSQVNFFGMSPPFGKAVLEIANAIWLAPRFMHTSHGFYEFTRIKSFFLLLVRVNPRKSVAGSLGRDGEVYRDASLGFDRLTGLQVRPETPLLHGLPGRSRKNRGSAEYVEVLNISVPSDQRFEHDRALNLHLLGQQGIVGFNRAGNNLRRRRRDRCTRPVASATPVESAEGAEEAE